MSREDVENTYKKWLVGKHIDGVEIVDVEYDAPPSGVFGVVHVVLENGKRILLTPIDVNAYRLRKKDLKYYVDEYKEQGDK